VGRFELHFGEGWRDNHRGATGASLKLEGRKQYRFARRGLESSSRWDRNSIDIDVHLGFADAPGVS
jgi:hypothetical protein